jgi:hypothetical protein
MNKTYTLTPAAQEAFDEWYLKSFWIITGDNISKILEAFFRAHPEHLTEQPSTSKRDEVLRVATALLPMNEKFSNPLKSAVDDAEALIAEVDKLFNTPTP